MKDAIKLGGFLLVVCVLASLILAMTYRATAPIIEQQKQKARQDALSEVLPAAATFEEKKTGAGKGPDVYFVGKDKTGNPVGVVMEVAPKGYGGPVTTMVGLGADRKITGIKIMNMQETPGLGAKAGNAAFTTQFQGKTLEQLYLKNKDVKTGDIDGITAATITSRAVTSGVRQGTEAMQNVLP